VRILVTGSAGFIGSHVAHALLDQGHEVMGLDNLNDYYEVALKQARLDRLQARPGYRHAALDLSDRAGVEALFASFRPERVVHLAAQAGVRYAAKNPHVYASSNLVGFLHILEGCRHGGVQHLVYASTSSVYGGNTTLPFSEHQPTEHPLTFYAATKKANEAMAHSYAHLYGLPCTGLRFFTVYGPWGRPDMAAYLFADAIVAGRPITVFNKGEMWRDFTFVDDIVAGVVAALDRPPVPDALGVRHRVYNLGNNRSERLLDFIGLIERELGRSAQIAFAPLQPGDVPATFADIEASRRDLGFVPNTTLAEGIPRFIAWYKSYTGVN
jgi:UDP-glucuronate 4-epimerase